MSKNAKQYAQEMLKMSANPQDRKEVINACLFVLKTLTDGDMSKADLEKVAGACGGCKTGSLRVSWDS